MTQTTNGKLSQSRKEKKVLLLTIGFSFCSMQNVTLSQYIVTIIKLICDKEKIGLAQNYY